MCRDWLLFFSSSCQLRSSTWSEARCSAGCVRFKGENHEAYWLNITRFPSNITRYFRLGRFCEVLPLLLISLYIWRVMTPLSRSVINACLWSNDGLQSAVTWGAMNLTSIVSGCMFWTDGRLVPVVVHRGRCVPSPQRLPQPCCKTCLLRGRQQERCWVLPSHLFKSGVRYMHPSELRPTLLSFSLFFSPKENEMSASWHQKELFLKTIFAEKTEHRCLFITPQPNVFVLIGKDICFCIVLFQIKSKQTTTFSICKQENGGDYLHTLGPPYPLEPALVVSLKDGKASSAT